MSSIYHDPANPSSGLTGEVRAQTLSSSDEEPPKTLLSARLSNCVVTIVQRNRSCVYIMSNTGDHKINLNMHMLILSRRG